MRDRVTPELREFVFDRDRECVLAKMDRSHRCRDAWGRPHPSWDVWRLTVEHVKSELRMGKRAPSDPAHLVALCGYANNKPPSKAERALFREYLAQQ